MKIKRWADMSAVEKVGAVTAISAAFVAFVGGFWNGLQFLLPHAFAEDNHQHIEATAVQMKIDTLRAIEKQADVSELKDVGLEQRFVLGELEQLEEEIDDYNDKGEAIPASVERKHEGAMRSYNRLLEREQNLSDQLYGIGSDSTDDAEDDHNETDPDP